MARSAVVPTPLFAVGYTHFSVYSTLATGAPFEEAGNTTTDLSQYIWQEDVPIIKPFTAMMRKDITVPGGTETQIFANNLKAYDVGSKILFLDAFNTQRAVNYYKHSEDDSSPASPGSIHTEGHPDDIGLQHDTVYSEGTVDGDYGAYHFQDLNANFSTNPGVGIEIGMLVYNRTRGSSAKIISFTSQIINYANADGGFGGQYAFFPGDDYVIGGSAAVIGAKYVYNCTRHGNEVNVHSRFWNAPGVFSESAIGHLLFWEDGAIDIITGFLGTHTVTVVTHVEPSEPRPDGVPYACAWEMDNGREYADVIPDSLLESRASFYQLQSQFASPMPNADIGALVPGFLATAKEDEVTGYYTQYNPDARYLVGHYQSDENFFVVDDPIKELQKMPDHLIVFCRNMTWKFQTNVINESLGTGILSGQSVVDEKLGVSDRAGVIAMGIGLKIVITNEPGIRTFDGYRYGENMLIEGAGRGLLKRDFEKLQRQIVAYYEPNLYGVIFYGYSGTDIAHRGLYDESIPVSSGPLLSLSNKCYRLAIQPQHGFGFAELSGSDWGFVELNGTPLLITDELGNKITLFFDRHGSPRMLSTREVNSFLGEDPQPINFLDGGERKRPDVGTSISWRLKLREHISKEEHWKLRYMDEHWYLRPYTEGYKNQPLIGSNNNPNYKYDKYGFRPNQRITIKLFKDGDANETSISHTVDPLATINQPYHVEARRIQAEISGTESEIILTGVQALYDTLKRRQPPGSQDETLYQNVIQQIVFRLSRGNPKDRDLATAGRDTAGNATFYSVEGPDTLSGSAFLLINGTAKYPAPIATFRQYIFTIKTDQVEYLSFFSEEKYNSPPETRLTASTSSSGLSVNISGANDFDIAFNANEWTTFLIHVSSDNSKLKWMKCTSDLNVVTGEQTYTGDPWTESGDELWISSSDSRSIYDFIVRDEADGIMTEDMFLYYCRDIYKYKGYSLIPAVDVGDYDGNQNKIVETGTATDIITESGSQPDQIVEGGG
jgi:hypothetical protein